MGEENIGIHLGETSQIALILSTASSYLKKISEFVPVKRSQICIILNIHSFIIVEGNFGIHHCKTTEIALNLII